MVASLDNDGVPFWLNRASYAYTATLSLREWTWEFLRRNPEFAACGKSAQTEYGFYGQDGATTIIVAVNSTLSLRRWGCLYATAPDLDARLASVFWCPDLCPSVLRFTASAVTGAAEPESFRLNKIACPSVLLEMANGTQHLLFTDHGRWLQIVFSGADILRPVRLTVEIDTESRRAARQLRALHCFNDLRFCGHLLASHFQPNALSSRLQIALQALDGSQAGATHREIGMALFGKDRVKAEWDHPARSLRDRTRRAIYRGRKLMQKTYINFLR